MTITGFNSDGTPASTLNREYDYILRYINEAIDARGVLIDITARAIRAYKGHPSKDGYIGAIERYAELFRSQDSSRADDIKRMCQTIQPRQNMIVSKSIDSMVAQAMGGVGQYECAPYDPHLSKDPELIDVLEEAAMNFYQDNHIDAVLPQMIEYAGLGGAAYAYLGYRLDKRKDNGVIDVQIVPSSEMLIDPARSKRNRDRYIGFQQTKSWNELKKHLKGKGDEQVLKSINEVDTYIRNVEALINKDAGRFTGIFGGTGARENLPADIDMFFRSSALVWAERNKDYLKTKSSISPTDDKRYVADDVEVSYIYDLENGIQFTVVNRLFIVEAKKDYLQGHVGYKLPVIDPASGTATDEDASRTISLDHPFVALEYKRSLFQTFSYSPLMDVLDMFDDICALETMIHHTISIMTPITFTGNPKDIEKLGQIAGVSGETIKGFIANSVTVLNKAVDLTPALSQITRLENTIADKLNGIDVRDQSRMVGDRATAAEAMGVASLVSQGLNSLLANVERFAEELMEKVFKLTVIYSDDDYSYNFDSSGVMQTLSRKDLAGDMHIRARLKSKIKAEQQSQAANTMQWFVPLMGSDAIPNKEAFAQSVIPTLARGFSRKTIASWFEQSAEQKNLIKAQLDNQAAQEEAARAVQASAQGIDMRYVDPTSGGQYSPEDIAGVMGTPELDMEAERSPVGGPNKPYPSARKLQYGIGNPGPEPLGFSIADTAGAPGADIQHPEAADTALNMALGGLSPTQTPTSGGMMANDPVTGANAPTGGF